jgi:hypothetical protein
MLHRHIMTIFTKDFRAVPSVGSQGLRIVPRK